MKNENRKSETGKQLLKPEYKAYPRQKCFVGHSQEASWSEDILNACSEVLRKLDLEPWYAADYFDPTQSLRNKVVELIANSRYGIYDLSSWQNKNGTWQLPRNVLIEVGIAIGLNRPSLLLRHTSNSVLPLPNCLEGMDLLEFAGEMTLSKELERGLAQWLDVPPDRDWLNRYCIFGNRICGFREQHPRARQWGQESMPCHVSDGLDEGRASFHQSERDEIRGAFEDVLNRYNGLSFQYLDELSLIDDYVLRLCSHCQVVRSTPFAVYRILPNSPAEVFIAIGISIALETVFEYKIPKVLMVRHEQDLPSILRGYDIVEAVNTSEAKQKLKVFIPTVMQKVREAVWKPRRLPFVEIISSLGGPRIDATESVALQKALGDEMNAALLSSILSSISTKVNHQSFDMWFKPISFARKDASCVFLEVPREVFRDWISENYSDVIEECFLELGLDGYQLEFTIAGTSPAEHSTSEKMFYSIQRLELPAGTAHRLGLAGIKYVGELVKKTPSDLKAIAQLGRKSVSGIRRALKTIGLDLAPESPLASRTKEERDYQGSRQPHRLSRQKIRVYELAKELKLDNKKVMEDARREGIDVSVPSNTIPHEVAERIRLKYFPKRIAPQARPRLVRHAPVKKDSQDTSSKPVTPPPVATPPVLHSQVRILRPKATAPLSASAGSKTQVMPESPKPGGSILRTSPSSPSNSVSAQSPKGSSLREPSIRGRFQGTVVEVLSDSTFRVRAVNGSKVVARISDKMSRNSIKVSRGDVVTVQSTDDSNEGRIIYRHREVRES